MTNQITVYKWSARIIGGLAVLFFGAFFIGGGIPDLTKDSNGHLSSMIILISFAILGYIFAWFREKEGGLVMIISGVIMGLNIFYSGGMKDWILILGYCLPFIIGGVLFFYRVKD